MIGAFLAGLLIGIGGGILVMRIRGRGERAGHPPIGDDPGERLVKLSEVTGGLAHEIRNPLSTVKVNLGLLVEDWQEGDEHHADLCRRSLVRIQGLQRETERLESILDDFMRFAGQHDVHLCRSDINTVVRKVMDFTAAQSADSGVRVRVSLSAEPLWCLLDEDLFEQAVFNIIRNAVQAMPEGGELIVKTQAFDGQVRLDIADTGAGMDPKELDKIFRAYYSTKKDGTGLGLSITRRIVAEHGGTIGAQSEPGRGTNFTIQLPVAPE